MSFDLRISFHGMCMFVRDGSDALHVLMPATGSDGCGCPPHSPRLIFNSAHLRPSQTAFDDTVVHRSLQNKKLEFADTGATLDNSLPTELAKTDTVRSDVFDETNTDPVASRVVLRNGSCSDYARGACWTWKGQMQRLSHVIEWTIPGVTGSSLDLELLSLTGASGGSVPTLYPVNGCIELEVWHAPHAELPPDYIVPARPSRGAGGSHFAAFGKLLDAGTTDVPEYEDDSCGTLTNPSKYDNDDRGNVTYSCTSAEGFKP